MLNALHYGGGAKHRRRLRKGREKIDPGKQTLFLKKHLKLKIVDKKRTPQGKQKNVQGQDQLVEELQSKFPL